MSAYLFFFQPFAPAPRCAQVGADARLRGGGHCLHLRLERLAGAGRAGNGANRFSARPQRRRPGYVYI